MKILAGSDFEIVGARHRQLDRRRAIKCGRQMRDVGPQKGLHGIAPSRRFTEQFLESTLFRIGIAAAIRLDSNLASQRNRMNRCTALLPDTNHEYQRWYCRIAFRTRRFDFETELSRDRRFIRPRGLRHLLLSEQRSPLRKSCPAKAAG